MGKLNTSKKVQKLQKKGTVILNTFSQMEQELEAHVKDTQEVQAELSAEIARKNSQLEEMRAKEQETVTVLQNLKKFLGRDNA